MLGYAGTIGGDTGRVSPLWLISANVLIAVGEICAQPDGHVAGQSAVAAAARGLMMGGWFASLGIGGYLSGYVGRYWETMPHSQFFFMVVGILPASPSAEPDDAADQAHHRAEALMADRD